MNTPSSTTIQILMPLLITAYSLINAAVTLITPETLQEKIANDAAILIDVREPAEFRAEHIENAISMPLSTVSPEAFNSFSKPVVFQCKSGRRSSDACSKIAEQLPQLKGYSLEGGIENWKKKGFPVIGAGTAPLPLERQTQIAAGTITLSGVLLGTFVNPWFYLMPGFVGCGLIFAGITGWCGMALFLTQLPWNQ